MTTLCRKKTLAGPKRKGFAVHDLIVAGRGQMVEQSMVTALALQHRHGTA
jgi:hypothetical protein